MALKLALDSKTTTNLVKKTQKKATRVALRTLQSTSLRVVQKITTEVIPSESRQPVDRGRYRASWRAKRRPYGADIVNPVSYASIIEYGVRAQNVKISRAMIAALETWVVRKGLATKRNARSVAFAVAKKMKERGIFNRGKGLRILRKSLKGIQKIYQQEYVKEFQKEFKL